MSETTVFFDSRDRNGYPASPSYKFQLLLSNVVGGVKNRYVNLVDITGVNYLYNVESEVEGKANNKLQITLGGTVQSVITITPGHYSLATLAAAITAADATLTLTQSSTTGLMTLTDSGGLTIGFSTSRDNNSLLEMLGFTNLTKTGAGGIITGDIVPNMVKHDVILLKCNNVNGFYDASDNQKSHIVATIPIGATTDWSYTFHYAPTAEKWVQLTTNDPVFEFVDKWNNPVKNIGEWIITFSMG